MPEPFQLQRSGGLSWIGSETSGFRAIFSTRQGGYSERPYDSLNLGSAATGDDPEKVSRNRLALAGAIDRPANSVVGARQVHGSAVMINGGDGRPAGYGDTNAPAADVQLVNLPELTSLVLTADCLPLVIGSSTAVAVAHCGWRGIAAGIIEQTVEALHALTGRSADQSTALLGPAIGPCCYRVDKDLRDLFSSQIDAQTVVGDSLDLPAVVRKELVRLGVDGDAIHGCDLCTSCNESMFFSHRRDHGVAGRQATLAWLQS